MAAPAPTTAFARKYGVAPSDRDTYPPIFHPRGKSGYTPTSLRTVLTSAADAEEAQRIDWYQTNRLLNGFAARELQDFGMFPDPALRSIPSITSRLHPIFHLTRWETPQTLLPGRIILPITNAEDVYDFGKFNTGLWTAANPAVWDALKPCLRLASRFLDTIHTSTWLDAFLWGEYRAIPDHLDSRTIEEKMTEPSLYTFHARDPVNRHTEQTLAGKKEALQILESKVIFCIGSSFVNAKNNQDFDPIKFYGCTNGHDHSDGLQLNPITLTLAHEILLPLLRKDMNPSELLTEQYFVACTMLHELNHAFHYSLVGYGQRANTKIYEPYFETEIAAELGFSMETALWGGATIPMMDDLEMKGYPHLGLWIENFPKTNMYYGQPIIRGKRLTNEARYHPIPSKHYENVQSDSYWEFVVKKWGLDAIKPHAGGFSSTVVLDSRRELNVSQTVKPSLPTWQEDIDTIDDAIKLALRMDPVGRQAYAKARGDAQRMRRIQDEQKFQYERGRVVDDILAEQANIRRLADGFPGFTRLMKYRKKLEAEGARQRLMQLFDKEARIQVGEILKVTKAIKMEEADYVAHLTFLQSVNRTLRRSVLELKASAEKKVDKQAEEIADILNHSSIALQVAGGTLEMSGFVMPATAEEFTTRKAFPSEADAATTAATTEDVAKAKDVESIDELEARLEASAVEGKTAIGTKNKELCRELGTRLVFESLLDNYFRSVGFILLAHTEPDDSMQTHGLKALEGLESLPDDFYHRDLDYWKHLAESMVQVVKGRKRQALANLRAPCAKRPRGPLEPGEILSITIYHDSQVEDTLASFTI